MLNVFVLVINIVGTLFERERNNFMYRTMTLYRNRWRYYVILILLIESILYSEEDLMTLKTRIVTIIFKIDNNLYYKYSLREEG